MTNAQYSSLPLSKKSTWREENAMYCYKSCSIIQNSSGAIWSFLKYYCIWEGWRGGGEQRVRTSKTSQQNMGNMCTIHSNHFCNVMTWLVPCLSTNKLSCALNVQIIIVSFGKNRLQSLKLRYIRVFCSENFKIGTPISLQTSSERNGTWWALQKPNYTKSYRSNRAQIM